MLSNYLLAIGGAKIGQMTVIGKAKIVGPKRRLEIGKECAIGRCEIALHAKVKIGDRVAINDGVKILSAGHDSASEIWEQVAIPIEIGDYAWIATNAILLPGANIGKGSIVGAGSVVNKNIPPYSIVIGNPAIILQKKRNSLLRYSPVKYIAAYEAWLGISD